MSEDRRERYQNPDDPLNGKEYHTGKLCIEGCGRLAGTHWSKLWCQPCNAERMKRISSSFGSLSDVRR